MANVQNFQKYVRGHGQAHMFQNLWYHRKGFVIKNTSVKCESPISWDEKVRANVKIFQK